MFKRCGRSRWWARFYCKMPEGDSMPENIEEAFRWMELKESHTVSRSEYASLLRNCGNTRNLEMGKSIHERLLQTTHVEEVLLGNLLIEMYGKCGCIEEARNVFISLRQANVYSWTIMIAAYARNGHYKDAMHTFRTMSFEGAKPDVVTFVTILDVYTAVSDLTQGIFLHECVRESGLEISSRVVGNTLINMYGKCRSVELAKTMFEKMENKDVVSWNSLLAAYVQNGHLKEALVVFWRMELEGEKPTSVTLAAVLDACSCPCYGDILHERVVSARLQNDAFVRNGLMKMYVRCGNVETARLVFERITQKDLIGWNVRISLEVLSGNTEQPLELFMRMVVQGFQPDRVTFISLFEACSKLADSALCSSIYKEVRDDVAVLHTGGCLDTDLVLGNALVNMFSKCGCLQEARDAFESLSRKNIVSWNCLLSGYAQNGHGKQTLELFKRMELEGVKANSISFVSAIDACTALLYVKLGKEIHERITQSGLESHIVVATALINMYGKRRMFEAAKKLLEGLQCKGLVTWNAMLSAYSQHGHTKEAMKVLRYIDFEGLEPDEVTYIGVLDACACSQDVSRSKALEDRIVAAGWTFQVTVSNTMINMYGKCGDVNSAVRVFENMHWRDQVSWNTMVGAYAHNGYITEALGVFRQMQQDGVKPQEATYVTIFDACGEPSAVMYGRSIHASIQCVSVSDVVQGALLDMYGKCGSIKEAEDAFMCISSRTLVHWTAMLAAYAHIGHVQEAFELFHEMQLEGVTPDEVTLSALVFACSHGGLVKEALLQFAFMRDDYGIPGQYESIVDVLARLGRLEEAEELVNSMPYEPDCLAWMSLLGACNVHGDVQRATRAAQFQESGAYVLLSNTYAVNQ